MANAYGKTHFLRDAKALASYEPRKSARSLIEAGSVDEYLEWELGPARHAAFGLPPLAMNTEARLYHYTTTQFLDNELNSRLFAASKKRHKPDLALKGIEILEDWNASPLELALRHAPLSGFEKTLDFLASPASRFAAPFLMEEACKAFTSGDTRALAIECTDWLLVGSASRNYSLLSFALLTGQIERADALAKRGICPEGTESWRTFGTSFEKFERFNSKALAFIVGQTVDARNFRRAQVWIAAKIIAATTVAEAWEYDGDIPEIKQSSLDEMTQAIDCGAAGFDYWPLARVCESADADLLRALIAAGANPNVLYQGHIPLLGALESRHITPEVLRIWLKAGANPARAGNASAFIPFGTGWSPSPLYQWVREGRQDLVEQACDDSVGPIEFAYIDEGKTYSPLLALALSQGHRKLAVWLIEQKGCRLEHFDSEEEILCSEYGSEEILAEAFAAQERLALDAVATIPKHRETRFKSL